MNLESSVKPDRPADVAGERGFPGFLRAAVRIAVIAGAAGSIGLTLWAGRRNDSRVLLSLFAIWVLSPFVALAVADLVSKRWSLLARATLQGVTLVLTLGSLASYGAVALGTPREQTAFAFVVLPAASWVIIAIVVSLAALISGRLFENRLAHWIFKGFAVLVTLGVLGVAALLMALWLEHGTGLTLPIPTGSFAVGRAIHDWADDVHPDPLAPVSGTKRELLVWIWYPSAPGRSVAVDDYVPSQLRAEGAPPGSLILRMLTRDLSKIHSHSIPNAEVSPQQRAYPVVIMRTGASAEVMNYTTLAEDLASHGYIVVGFDAPYRTFRVVFPDGRVITRAPENNPELYEGQPKAGRLNELLTAWTADMGFVLDRLERLNASDPSGKFTGRLDLMRVGVFGHSFGGAQAAQFCSQDSRCKAGIDVDGLLLGSVVQTGLHQPFMFLLSDQNSSDAEGRQVMADIQSIYDRLPQDGRLMIKIRGANHFLFSDDGALLKSHIVLGTLRRLGIVGIDGRRQLAITTYCVHSFFDAYLKGGSISPLKNSSPLYPEIQVLE